MAIPLITNDFLSPPPPPSAVSPTVANLLAMGGQAIAQRAEKNAQVQEARALAPTITQGYASGYAKIADGNFDGFHDMVAASMIGVGNPLLMETAKEAVQAGTTIAHSYMQDKLLQEQLGSRERIASGRDATRIAVGAGGSDVAQGRLDLARQAESDRVNNRIANYRMKFKQRQDDAAAYKQKTGQDMPGYNSNVTLDDGSEVPLVHPDDFEKNQKIQLNQQFPVQQESSGGQTPQGDTSLNPPLPVAAPINETDARYATANPSLTRPANSDSDFIRQGSNNAPSAIAPPGTGNNGEAGQVPVTADQLAQKPNVPQVKPAANAQEALDNMPQKPPTDKPVVALVNEGAQNQPRMVLKDVKTEAGGKFTITEVPNPMIEEHRKALNDANDNLSVLNGDPSMSNWIRDRVALNQQIGYEPIVTSKKDQKAGGEQAMLYTVGAVDKDHPNGRYYYQDPSGAKVIAPTFAKAYSDFRVNLAKAGQNMTILVPDKAVRLNELQQAANKQTTAQPSKAGSVLPQDQAQNIAGDANYYINILGPDRYNKIISDKSLSKDQKLQTLKTESNELHSIVKDTGAITNSQVQDIELKARQDQNATDAQRRVQGNQVKSENAADTIKEWQGNLDQMKKELSFLNYTGKDPGIARTVQMQAFEKARQIKELQDRITSLKKNL